MNVSIIIPTFNKLPRLKLMISCVCVYDGEIIIVDDGSTDGTEDYLRDIARKNENIKVVRSNRVGRGKARNIGAGNAEGSVLLFLDDDILINSIAEYVSLHEKEHNNNQHLLVHGKIQSLEYLRYFDNPTVGIPYTGINISPQSKLKEKCISINDIHDDFLKKVVNQSVRLYMDEIIDYIDREQLSIYYGWLMSTGTCISIRKDDFDSINGFSDSYGIRWGGEDFDLGYRFALAGGAFTYLKKAIAYHIAHNRNDYIQDLKIAFNIMFNEYKDPYILRAASVLLREKNIEYLTILKEK